MKKILFALVLTVIVLSSCGTSATPRLIPTNMPVLPTVTQQMPQTESVLSPVVESTALSPTQVSSSVATKVSSATATSIAQATAIETPYPYEGSYPGLGKQMLSEWASWRKKVTGPIVDNIPDGTVMQTESPSYSERLLLEAINRNMAPDLSGMDRGVALVNFNATPGKITITPEIMAELEKQNVALIFGFGVTNGRSGGIYETQSQMVKMADQPNKKVMAVLVGGSKQSLHESLKESGGPQNLYQSGGFAAFHDTAQPQAVTMDMANKNVIYVVPLNKESLRQFARRNGILIGGQWEVLITSFEQLHVMRANETIHEFLGIP